MSNPIEFESVEHATRVVDDSMAKLLAMAAGTMPDSRPAPAHAQRLARQ